MSYMGPREMVGVEAPAERNRRFTLRPNNIPLADRQAMMVEVGDAVEFSDLPGELYEIIDGCDGDFLLDGTSDTGRADWRRDLTVAVREGVTIKVTRGGGR